MRIITSIVGTAFLLIACAALTACSQPRTRLLPPTTLSAPYAHREVWAVAPFINESGASIVDPFHTADLFAQQVQQVNGLDTVPVNRVIAAVRELELPAIRHGRDAQLVMQRLNVDALLVGTVTAYDPYSPPTLGMAVELYRRDRRIENNHVDPRELSRQTRGEVEVQSPRKELPAAQAASVFDGANHRVLEWLDEYATGRNVPDSAYGKQIYLVDMELYTQFVAYRLLQDLLDEERLRGRLAGNPRRR